jgi:coenzyme F420-dependent glucose-6-phosphate dehydrogenase
MPSYGFSLICELYDPNELLAQAARAEAAGFDFLTISDHFTPGCSRTTTAPTRGACSER